MNPSAIEQPFPRRNWAKVRHAAIYIVESLEQRYLLSASAVSTGWTTYQGDSGHTGYVPGIIDPFYEQTLWSSVMPDGTLTDMAVGNGQVYVSSDNYNDEPNVPALFAVNATTGLISWTKTIGGTFSTNGPAYSNESVYVQTVGGTNSAVSYLWSFDATTGAQNFQTSLSAQWDNYLNPTIVDGSVYIDSGYGNGVYALSAGTGALNWSAGSSGYDYWTPAVNGNYCYYYISGGSLNPWGGEFVMLDRLTGAQVAVTPDTNAVSDYSMRESAALGPNSDAFATNGNRILCFNTGPAGGIDWIATDHYVGQVTVANGVLYVQDGNGIAALSEDTGATLWTWAPPNNDSISKRIIATDNMLFASGATTTYAINLQTRQTAWTVAHSGNLALDSNTLYIAGADGTLTAIGMLPAAAPPSVFAFTPTGLQSTAPPHVDFNFTTAMDPKSFSMATGMDAFTGPGGADVSSSITGYAWQNNNTTLEIDFTPPTVQGPYTMTIGPQILSAGGVAMDQNQNGVSGEIPQDQFSGTFDFDAMPRQVASTNPAVGAMLAPPFTTLDLSFNAPLDPLSVSPANLALTQGSATAAKVINPTTVEYTLGGVTDGGQVTVTLAQGALKDANENPVLAFSGTYIIPAPPPASDWSTYQGNADHTGYVPGSLEPVYHQTLWSTVLPDGNLTDMAVGGGQLYVSSDVDATSPTRPALFALSAATGALDWQTALGATSSTTGPAYSNGMVFVESLYGETGSYYWSFNAATGTQNSKTPFSSQGYQYLSPTVAGGSMYAPGGYAGGMYALSSTNGAVNWSTTTIAQVNPWTPAVDSKYAYVYTPSSGTAPFIGQLSIFDRLTGALVSVAADINYVWYSPMNEAVALGPDNDAFATNGNRVLCFSTQLNRGINWVATDQYSGQVTVANGVVYVQDGNGIAALSEATGAKLWAWAPPAGAPGLAGRIIADDDMLFVCNSTTTYAVSLSTHQTLWSLAHGGNLALDGDTLYIASSDGTVTAIGLLPAFAPPFVSGFAPAGLQSTGPSQVDFTFSTAMDPASFSVASDVDLFVGPGNTDLRSSITGYSWLNNNTTLEVDFSQAAVQGPYTMTIGPQILSATGTAMDQNRDGTPGEVPQDQFSGTFHYDTTPTRVASTNPAYGAFVAAPFTTIDLHFSAPFDPATVGEGNLTLNQGSVTAATIIDATTARYTLSGTVTGGTVTVTLPQGALLDANENPVLAFTGTYVIPVPPPPSTGWGTYQGDAGHTGYASGTFDPAYHQTLWSTVLPFGYLSDMSVGGSNLYVSSDVDSQNGTAVPDLFALNAASGTISWQEALGSNSSANAPAYSNGALFVQTVGGSYGNYLWSFNAATGAVTAKTSLNAQWDTYLSPTVAYGNVYVNGGTYGGMYSLSASTGAQSWFNGTLQQVDEWTPAVNSAYCYAYLGTLSILDRITGKTVWITTDPGSVINGYSVNMAVALGSYSDALVANNNRVVSFSAQPGGGINWAATDQYTGQVTVAGGVVYVHDDTGIAALSETNGAKLWSWAPSGDSISGRIIATDDMLFTSSATATYAISLATHQALWTVAHGGHLALDGSTLYISGADGTVTAIGMQYATAVSLALTAGPNPSSAANPLTFRATVAGGMPDEETVSLIDTTNNNAVVATGTLSNGSATLTVPGGTFSVGTHSLIAVYGGDANFAASESALFVQTVNSDPLPSYIAASAGAAFGYNSVTGALNLTGGTLTFTADNATAPLIKLTASGPASGVFFDTSEHLAGLTLSGGAQATALSLGSARTHSNHNVLVIGTPGSANDPTFSIDASSKLDLTDNDLIVHTGSSDNGNGVPNQLGVPSTNELGTVRALALRGRNVAAGSVLNGTWTGNELASSSAGSVDAKAGYEQNVLAVVQNSDQILGKLSSWTVGPFSEPLGSNDIIVKYTYNGDAALEGYVGDDSVTIVNGFYDGGKSAQNDWAFGDFTGDGKVDDNDITILNGLYGLGTTSSGLAQL